MNSRVIVAATRALLLPRNNITAVRNSSHYKPPASWFEPTLSELPVPQGSWQAAYDAQQKKFNLHLIVGVSFFLLTMTVLKTSDLIDLNRVVPPLPEDE